MKVRIRVTDAMVDAGARAAYEVDLDGDPKGTRRATWDAAGSETRRIYLIEARAAITAALDAR